MSPVDRAASLTGTNFTLGSYEKFQPGFRDEKRPKTSCGAKFEKQSKHGETQNYNFHASYGCITAVEWDAYDKMTRQDDLFNSAQLYMTLVEFT